MPSRTGNAAATSSASDLVSPPRIPRIGITTYGRDENDQFQLPCDYVDAVRRAGGLPLLLPPGETQVDDLLDLLDGLVLAGGGDLSPSHYGGKPHETIYMTDEERDGLELTLAREIRQRDLPTLAICRGAQVVNVERGGTLIEHLPDEVGEEIAHRAPPREPTPHALNIVPGTRLARILEATELTAQSWHHQAVRDLAPGLVLAARAPDGVIEGFEDPDHRWLLAVQWHPELTARESTSQQNLFNSLVEAARDAASSHGR